MARGVLNRRSHAGRGILRRIAGRLRRAPGRFAREERGASAVEFAIVGPMFLFTVFAMFETASIYWVDRILQSYASDVARAERVDYVDSITEIGPLGTPITRQKDLCRDGIANMLFNCNLMMVDIRETDKVTNIRKPDGSIDTATLIQAPGLSGTVNIVRVYYNWPRLFGVPFTPAGKPRPDGDVELYASVGFVKE